MLFVGRDAEALEEAANGCGGEYLAVDVTAEADERIVAECAERSAASTCSSTTRARASRAPLEKLTDDDWRGQWELHVMALVRPMRAAAPRWRRRRRADRQRLLGAGKRPSLTNAAYSVTKAAQLSLSRVFADSYAGDGVLVNAVAPGAVGSSLWLGEGGLADQARAPGVTREEALERRRPRSRSGASPSRTRSRRRRLPVQRAGGT